MKKQIIIGLSLLIGGALQAQEAGSYLHFNVGGGVHNLSYEIPNGTEKGQAGYTLNAAYSYFFNPHWGLQIGFGFQSFKALSTLSTMTSITDVDTDGDSYQYRTYYKSWQEKQEALFMDIPLELQYRLGIGKKTSILASAGVKMALPVSASYKSTAGQIQTTGYYSQWNVELTDLAEHGFTTITNNYSGNLSFKPTFMGIVDLGGLYKLSEKIDLYAGAYLNYGLNKVNIADTKTVYQKDGTYNGMFASDQISNVKPVSVGIKVGLYWKLATKKTPAQPMKVDEPLVSTIDAVKQPLNLDTLSAVREEAPIVPEVKKDIVVAPVIIQNVAAVENVMKVDSLKIIKDLAQSISINFEENSDQVSIINNEKIRVISNMLKVNPDLKLKIIGHTCNIGSHAANMKVGMKRAEAIKQKFIEQGVSESQLITQSKAYDVPLVPNTSEENRTKNRRVEMTVFLKNK
ncbi:MAG: OmpA family protein [Paludibacter sp.]|nr:OmpA family protein [Paludibacter sp.]